MTTSELRPMVTLGLLFAALLAAGCGSGGPPLKPTPFDVALLAGKRFQSLEPQPIGPKGSGLKGTWTVRFDDPRKCYWGYYNVLIPGVCEVLEDGTIVAKFAPQPVQEVRGSYDPETQRLVFDGVAYAADQPLDSQQVRTAQSAENLRLLTLIKYLERKGHVLQEDQAVGWRVAGAQGGVSVGVALWAFPVGTSHEQMQAATGLESPGDVLLDEYGCMAMTPPAYYDAKGEVVEVEDGDEALEQLAWEFQHFEPPDLPADYGLRQQVWKKWSQSNNATVRRFFNYLVGRGLTVEFDLPRGYWEIDAGSSADRIRILVRAVPDDATELEMRCLDHSTNLAFMINTRAGLLMSHPPDSTDGKRLTELFLNYRP